MENFLTHLELQGFKSFASKTEFEFDNRIVGIVGPNGSGKSNVIDALRWVLGEREAKNLRGDSLDNLVFAGTPGKSPASLARVTLRFNNQSGLFPVEAREVSVSRRIDRTGTSQFYINNQEVRLKDLISSLAKARLGSRGFSIIGQGETDVFVRVNSRERREMIEEILGLKEFRLKKKTAERQLSQAKTNMEQLTASLSEMEPHLKFLRKQKKKWEQRSEIEEKLKKLSQKYFSYHYHKFTGCIKELEKELAGLEKDKNEINKKTADLRGEVKAESSPREEEMKEIRQKLEQLRNQRLEMEKESARMEARMEERKEKQEETPKSREYSSGFLLSNIKSFIDEAYQHLNSNDLEKTKEVLGKWVRHFQGFFARENKKKISEPENDKRFQTEEKKMKEIQGKIEEIDKMIKEREREEKEILSSREEESRKLKKKVEALENEKNKEKEIEDKIKEKEMAKERSEFQLKNLKNKWCSLGFSMEELEKLEKPVEEPEEGWDKVERKIDRLNSQLSAIGEIDESLAQEARETEERYESYIRELEDLRKSSEDLKTLISDLERKIHKTFKESFSLINKEFNNYFRLMFGGGKAKLKLAYPQKSKSQEEGEENEKSSSQEASKDKEEELQAGVEISLSLPKKKVSGLEVLSGGEKTLVSIAALFALVSVSPPPFLVLDEIDATLDDKNAYRFSELVKEFSEKTQFIIVTHNKITMEAAGTLYGVTMGDDGVSEVLSLKLEDAEGVVEDSG